MTEFDKLRMFRGKPYALNDVITIRQPTLGEICDYGERDYFSLVKTICATPADRKVEIWDAFHIYWEKMDEFDLFLSLFGVVQKTDAAILLPDLDVKSFQLVVSRKTSEVVLRNKDGVIIDRAIHSLMTDYIRSVHRFKKNVDVGYDDTTRDIMIEDDREEQELAMKKPYASCLLPMISALTNCQEFKYRFDDVWTMPVGAFMDSVERIQKVKGSDYMMHGIYSGCVDIKKINKKDLNWMGEL